MRGLVLEGGGVKGAYHIGVLTAFREAGQDNFDGYVGTSIGAVNAAMLAAGDWDKTITMWQNINMQNVLNIDENNFTRIIKGKFNVTSVLNDVGKVVTNIADIMDNSADKMRAYLKNFIDEEAIRNNNVDFGLVTYSIPDFEPHYLMKDDIPQGQIYDYVMASAAYPAFKWQKIEGKQNKWFIDGGVYDNLPINMLAERDYDEIVAIRTNVKKLLPYRKVSNKKTKIIYFIPSEKLDFAMEFTKENVQKYLKMGYYDGQRYLKNMDGHKYCIYQTSKANFEKITDTMNNDDLIKIVNLFKLKPHKSKDANLEDLFDILKVMMSIRENTGEVKTFISFVETFAQMFNIDRFNYYTLDELYMLVMNTAHEKCEKLKSDISYVLRRDKTVRIELKQIFEILYNGYNFE